MVVPLSINPEARDFIFTFNDSCNCCCWGKSKMPKDEDEVFITKSGKVEKLNPKNNKASIDSNRKTIERLEKKIEQLSKAAETDEQEIKNKLYCKAGVTLDQSQHLYGSSLKKVNDVFCEILDESRARRSNGSSFSS